MKPNIWGPHAWIFLHSITLNYPDKPNTNDIKDMKNFIDSLGNILPCSKCNNNFKDHLKVHPITEDILKSKNKFIKWMIDIHNSINKLNKKRILTYEEGLRDIIELYEDTKPNYVGYIIFFIFIFIFVLIIIGYLLCMRR